MGIREMVQFHESPAVVAWWCRTLGRALVWLTPPAQRRAILAASALLVGAVTTFNTMAGHKGLGLPSGAAGAALVFGAQFALFWLVYRAAAGFAQWPAAVRRHPQLVLHASYWASFQERDILHCADGQVTFRYRDSKSGKNTTRTCSGAHFLWLVLQHVLPRGFRRSRNFGLLHPNCRHRQRLALLRMGLRSCPASMQPSAPPSTQPPLSERPKLQCHCCGSAMVIVRRRIAPQAAKRGAAGPPGAPREGLMT